MKGPKIFDDKKYLFISGGIGITPFISILRNLKDKNINYDISLIHSEKYNNIPFFNELLGFNIHLFVFLTQFLENFYLFENSYFFLEKNFENIIEKNNEINNEIKNNEINNEINKNEINNEINKNEKNNEIKNNEINKNEKIKFFKGRIKKQLLNQLIKDLNEREIYLCGPKKFNDQFLFFFVNNLGFNKNMIHLESFDF
jgi:ferredoxin-NADP reductase